MLDDRIKLFRRRLLKWYATRRRDLPWRPGPGSPRYHAPDPYYVLVSEAMLQQTQVATVIPYFNRFIHRFPTLADLAAVEEQDVLRLWQGLGYYSRARNLLATARIVVREFGGSLPRSAEQLRRLPGIGRYTAGAIASIAFGEPAPILDGNVARVLCRIDRIESDPRQASIRAQLWENTGRLVPQTCPGNFNSALMDLGATVCTPRNPQCLICPVKEHCEALAAGLQARIPPPRQAKTSPLLRRWTFCIREPKTHRWLLEQRPARGRWAGMWQFVTIEADETPDAAPTAKTLHNALSIRTSDPTPVGKVRHALTHRRYEFDVFRCDLKGRPRHRPDRPRAWVPLSQLCRYPLPKPHLLIGRSLRIRDGIIVH